MIVEKIHWIGTFTITDCQYQPDSWYNVSDLYQKIIFYLDYDIACSYFGVIKWRISLKIRIKKLIGGYNVRNEIWGLAFYPDNSIIKNVIKIKIKPLEWKLIFEYFNIQKVKHPTISLGHFLKTHSLFYAFF